MAWKQRFITISDEQWEQLCCEFLHGCSIVWKYPIQTTAFLLWTPKLIKIVMFFCPLLITTLLLLLVIFTFGPQLERSRSQGVLQGPAFSPREHGSCGVSHDFGLPGLKKYPARHFIEETREQEMTFMEGKSSIADLKMLTDTKSLSPGLMGILSKSHNNSLVLEALRQLLGSLIVELGGKVELEFLNILEEIGQMLEAEAPAFKDREIMQEMSQQGQKKHDDGGAAWGNVSPISSGEPVLQDAVCEYVKCSQSADLGAQELGFQKKDYVAECQQADSRNQEETSFQNDSTGCKAADSRESGFLKDSAECQAADPKFQEFGFYKDSAECQTDDSRTQEFGFQKPSTARQTADSRERDFRRQDSAECQSADSRTQEFGLLKESTTQELVFHQGSEKTSDESFSFYVYNNIHSSGFSDGKELQMEGSINGPNETPKKFLAKPQAGYNFGSTGNSPQISESVKPQANKIPLHEAPQDPPEYRKQGKLSDLFSQEDVDWVEESTVVNADLCGKDERSQYLSSSLKNQGPRGGGGGKKESNCLQQKSMASPETRSNDIAVNLRTLKMRRPLSCVLEDRVQEDGFLDLPSHHHGLRNCKSLPCESFGDDELGFINGLGSSSSASDKIRNGNTHSNHVVSGKFRSFPSDSMMKLMKKPQYMSPAVFLTTDEMDHLWEKYNDASIPEEEEEPPLVDSSCQYSTASELESDASEFSDMETTKVCCLSAIKFSRGKMHWKKPSLKKVTKALKKLALVQQFRHPKTG